MNEGNEWVNSDAFIPYDDRGRGQINSGMGGYPRYGNQHFFNLQVSVLFFFSDQASSVSFLVSLFILRTPRRQDLEVDSIVKSMLVKLVGS